MRLGSTTKKEFYNNFASACKNHLNPYLDVQRTVRIGGQAQEVQAGEARHDETTADKQNQVGECFNIAENGGYPPTQNGDIRSLFMLFTLLAMQN